jgi:hypothetical protein
MTVAADRIEGGPDEREAHGGPDQASVTARLDTLDRRMKRVAMIGLAGVTASLALAGAALYAASGTRALTQDGVVQARRLVLADGAGRPRAVLATDPNGAASLYLTDTSGRPRATLGVGADGAPALGLGDAGGIVRAAVAVGADGRSSVGFFDPRRNVRARLGLGPDAIPALDMFDDRERDRVLLSVEPGRSLLRIADRSGQTRIGLGLAAGAPGLVVFDESGAPVRELR